MSDDVQSAADIWSRKLSRRGALKLSAAAGGAAVATRAGVGRAARRASDTVKVASMFDQTGNLSVYGAQMMDMSKFTVDTINKQGGVLGKKLELITRDTQSRIDLYSRYAQEIGTNKDVVCTVACITSASREATRPVLVDRYGKLLFYPVIYEGGVCDKWVFVGGSDPDQQQVPLINWASKNVGKTYYTVAADYNYGHIASDWTKILVAKAGGKVQNTEFIPLEVSDFSSTIQRIQAAKPKLIMSHLVGANHLAFYHQFAAAGLNKQIQIVSPTFGLGNEEQALTPAEGKGIVVAYAYFQTVNTPANKAFVAAFRKAYPKSKSITDLSAQTWNSWHQWKLAVEKAKTFDRDAVIKALETGISFNGPGGVVKVFPPTHHNIQDVWLGRVNNHHTYDIIGSLKNVRPASKVPKASQSCNLLTNPGMHTQIAPKA